jgi:hypothetical protein
MGRVWIIYWGLLIFRNVVAKYRLALIMYVRPLRLKKVLAYFCGAWYNNKKRATAKRLAGVDVKINNR